MKKVAKFRLWNIILVGFIILSIISTRYTVNHPIPEVHAQAATIGLDSVGTASNEGVSSISWQHKTTSLQNNVILLVTVGTGKNWTSVSSVTYNGTALTQLKTVNCVLDSSDGDTASCRNELWYLVNPSQGTHTVSVNLNNTDSVIASSTTFYNINPLNPFGTIASGSNLSSSSSLTVSKSATQVIFDNAIWKDDTSSVSPANGQSVLWNLITSPSIHTAGEGATITTGSGNITIGWNTSFVADVEQWAEIAVPLNPFPGPTSTPTPSPTLAPCASPTFSISGSLFVDNNEDGYYNSGDTVYTGSGQTITLTGCSKTVTVPITNGTYTAGSLPNGSYTITYNGPPGGYYISYPKTSVPPSFIGTIGPSCSVNTNDASCQGSNIINLNFGMTNGKPWMQSICGDVRQDTGITNPLPANVSMMQTDSQLCPVSNGVAFTGNAAASFGQGQVAAPPTNWLAGGTTYPEVYNPAIPQSIHTSCTRTIAQTKQAGITPVDLSTICTLSNCTLPPTLAHGVYQANGNLLLNGFTFPANQNYVFIVTGDFTVLGNISIPVGSTALFSSCGNTYVDKGVGSTPSVTTSNLDGFYSADKSFTINAAGGCSDLRLNTAGSIIVNAGLQGGTFQNNRSLCGNNSTYPSLSMTQRPDLILNTPDLLKTTNHIWQEVLPGTTPAPTPTTIPVTNTPIPTPTSLPTPPSFDVASGVQTGSGGSLSWNHTITTQANRLLLVTISYSQTITNSSSVTFNGVALTKIGSKPCSNACNVEMWYLLNPPSGSHTINVSFSGTAAIVAGSSSYSNVNQSTPLGTFNTASGNSTSGSVTLANTTTTQFVVDAMGAWGVGGPYSANSPQTQLYEDNSINAGGSSYRAAASGSTTMNWSINPGSGDAWALVAVPIIGGSSGLPTTLTPTPTPTPTSPPTPPSFDVASGVQTGSGGSLSWNHTTTSQANRLLIVTVSYSATNMSSSQVTYNGVNMTKAGAKPCPNACNVELWYLVNPASGTHSVNVTESGSGAIVAGSSSYYNVNQTTPVGTAGSASGNGTTGSVTVSSTTTTQFVVDVMGAWGVGGPYSANSPQTQLYENNTINAGGSSYRAAASGTTTMNWSINPGSGDAWALVAVPIIGGP